MHRLHFEALVALINKGLKIGAVIIDMPTYVGLKREQAICFFPAF